MTTTLFLFALISCLGMLVQSTVGFAGALLAVPLFAMLWTPREVVPVYILVMMTVNPLIIWDARKFVQWPIVKTLIITGFPASLIGVWALDVLPTTSIRLFISSLTLIFGLLFLFQVPLRFSDTKTKRLFVGTLSGFLGGSIAASGPPVVLYGIAQQWKKNEMRATLLAFFFLLNLSSGVFSIARGMVSKNGFIMYAAALIPVILVSRLGVQIKNRLNENIFRKAVLGVILFVGALGVVNFR